MSRNLRIGSAALAVLLASAACGAAAYADRGAPPKPERRAAPPPASTSAEAPAQQQSAPTPAAPQGAVEDAPAAPPSSPTPEPAAQPAAETPRPSEPAPVTQQSPAAASGEPQQAPPPAEGEARQGAAAQAPAPDPRFKVEAIDFRAVDESGPNYPDSDIVFAVFESGRQSMVTRVFEDVDTGDARAFDANESCIFPALDEDAAHNGAWACAADGEAGPIHFAIGLYEIDADYVGDFTEEFCTPAAAADVATVQRNCDTDLSDLMFRSEFSYPATEMLRRLDPRCRCFNETVRFRERSVRGDVEYQVTFRITRTDAGDSPPANENNADHAVYRAGARSAALGQGIELDGGVSAAIAPDIAFSGAPSALMFAPSGGAKIWPGDATSRGYAACSAERRSANYVTTAIAAPAVGQYVCYVTNNGRVGELRVDNLTTSFANAVLSVSYTTWQ